MRRAACVIAGTLIALSPYTKAEDVDIFAGPQGTGNLINVLIVLDSSSNWSATLGPNTCNTGNTANNTKFAAEVCALRTILPQLPTNSVRLGIMMFTETGTNGAYVRFGVRNMNSGNKPAMDLMLTGLVQSGSGTDNSGSNQPYAKAMFEAFKYFGGGGSTRTPQAPDGFGREAFAGGPSNTGARRRDFAYNGLPGAALCSANPTGPRSAYVCMADGAYALNNSTQSSYSFPILSNCSKNFIIFISNGNPGTGGDSGTPDAATLLSRIGGNPTDRIKMGGAEIHASLMDEFARHLFTTDVSDRIGEQVIRTYTLGVYQPQANGSISNTDQQMIKLMKSAADVGGGKYFAATNATEVTNAILSILNEVQAVNSVFVSASLPVSVNAQGLFLNQVYMGLFRPDGAGGPRWLGNMKQFKFAQDGSTGDLYLADSFGNRAVNPATGFFSPTSVSYWTTPSAFWTNDQKGIPKSPSDAPDGDVVEKGGSGQVQRQALASSQNTRRLYTCPLTGCSPGAALLTQLDGAVISGTAYQTAFGAASAAELSLLVNWIRGEDNARAATQSPLTIGQAPCDPALAGCTWASGERGPGWPTTVRPSLHGDVLHSRPLVLNYSTALGHVVNGPYIFYGANDGFFRAVEGGQGAADGREAWAFVAPEFFGKFRRQRFNSPAWLTPSTPPALPAAPKDYFFDGPIGSFEDNTVSPPRKWIFVGARRGGRLIYAFDVTNPENPVFKWKVTSADLPQLGQTWSLPVAFKLTGVADPFLVFGAGYDSGEDATPPTSSGIGRGIYVLNANTGALLRFIDSAGSGAVTSPIVADMAFLTRPSPSGIGDVYRSYVGDLNGNVWRLDIPDGNVSGWSLHRFATLGAGQKFLYAADLVKAGNRDMVMLGSGDREKPLLTTSQDRFFGLADFANATTPLTGSMTPLQVSDLQSLSGDAGVPDSCTTCKGWYRALATGEKVVNSPFTIGGVTYFSTNKPTPTPPSSCEANLGEARAYRVSFLSGGKPLNAGSISTVLIGGGLASSPVGGVVELEPGKQVPFLIGGGKDGLRTEPERPELNVPPTRTKIYWDLKSDN